MGWGGSTVLDLLWIEIALPGPGYPGPGSWPKTQDPGLRAEDPWVQFKSNLSLSERAKIPDSPIKSAGSK